MSFRYGRTIGALIAVGSVTSACASIIEGRSQQISVTTNPPGADCGLYREAGVRIATIQNTPGSALVQKSKQDIRIVCVKPGYQRATYTDHSGLSGATAVNVIGGIFTLGISTAVGAAVDSSNGAANKYESQVNLSMVANEPNQPEGPSTLPRIFGSSTATATTTSMSSTAIAVPTVGESSSQKIEHSSSDTLGSQSTLAEAGAWTCGIKNFGSTSRPYYTLKFIVGADRTVTVVSYANARAALLKSTPLIFTAVNPRGSRLTTFTLRSDNSITVTGPSINDSTLPFYNEGTCEKA